MVKAAIVKRQTRGRRLCLRGPSWSTACLNSLLESTFPFSPWTRLGPRPGGFMQEKQVAPLSSSEVALLDLGVVLGQTHAFGMVAGRFTDAPAPNQRDKPKTSRR